MKKQSSEYRYAAGNVCQDPQKRTTQSGKDFYVFDLAVHYGNGITEFISVSSWNNSVGKGDFIKVGGPVRMYRKLTGDLKPWINAQHIVVLRKALSHKPLAKGGVDEDRQYELIYD